MYMYVQCVILHIIMYIVVMLFRTYTVPMYLCRMNNVMLLCILAYTE
jgi:hypothetical protein